MMSKANRRYLRSVLMLVAAMGGLVWAAVDLFNIPLGDMWSLFKNTALVISVIIVFAAACLMLGMFLRRLLNRVAGDNADEK